MDSPQDKSSECQLEGTTKRGQCFLQFAGLGMYVLVRWGSCKGRYYISYQTEVEGGRILVYTLTWHCYWQNFDYIGSKLWTMNMCTGNDTTTHWPRCVCVDTRICISISIYLSVIWHVCICVFNCIGICVYFQRWSEVYTGRDKLTECPHCGFMRGYYPSPRLQYSWNILPFVSFINSKTLLTFLHLVKSSECSVEYI